MAAFQDLISAIGSHVSELKALSMLRNAGALVSALDSI